MGVSKLIIVDARCFDPDTDENLGDFQDAYLARFLNEAIENDYEIHILTDGSEISQTHTALDTAAGMALDYLEDYVDADILKHAVYTYDEYHLIDKHDLVTETAYNALKGIKDQSDKRARVDQAALLISSRAQIAFIPTVGSYGHFVHPKELERLNAFEEIQETLKQDSSLRQHIVESAKTSAQRQLTMILDKDRMQNDPKGKIKAANKKIEQSAILQDFYRGHALDVETPKEKPNQSKAQFYLTCYFTNAVRLKEQDSLTISRTSEIENEQEKLADLIGQMRNGHDALAEMNSIIVQELYASPSGP